METQNNIIRFSKRLFKKKIQKSNILTYLYYDRPLMELHHTMPWVHQDHIQRHLNCTVCMVRYMHH
jgi:hypothetical protein